MLTQFVLHVPQRHASFLRISEGQGDTGELTIPLPPSPNETCKPLSSDFSCLLDLLFIYRLLLVYTFSQCYSALALSHSSFCFLISLPLVLTSFIILGLLTQLSVQTPTSGTPPLLHSHPQPLHPLTPSPPGWDFFFFLFKYLDRSHCGFFFFFPCTFQNCFCHFCFPFLS